MQRPPLEYDKRHKRNLTIPELSRIANAEDNAQRFFDLARSLNDELSSKVGRWVFGIVVGGAFTICVAIMGVVYSKQVKTDDKVIDIQIQTTETRKDIEYIVEIIKESEDKSTSKLIQKDGNTYQCKPANRVLSLLTGKKCLYPDLITQEEIDEQLHINDPFKNK